jgi:arylsulfatase A-like enzyme
LKPNIILVLLDGSRWDRTNISSDFLDLQKKGTFVNNVTTTAPYTFSSVNTIFTGKYGKENGVNAYYKMFKLKDSVAFLPEILKKNGYVTSCNLISNKVISSRGFDIYESHNEYEDDLSVTHPQFLQKTFEIAAGKPIFTFLQFSKIHTATVSEVLKKYEWNDEAFYEKKDQNRIVYDNAFLSAGKYAKIIYDELSKLDKLSNTIIIFFSDHGTGIGERFGERNYGVYLFEETIRTFYLFIGPNMIKTKKSESLLSTIDILPTILDLCKIDQLDNLLGQSISKFLTDQTRKLIGKTNTFSETGGLQGPFPSFYEPNVFCIKSSQYKLIYYKTTQEWLLFDLLEDPLETINLYGKELEIENKLKQKLLEWIDR